MKHPYSILAFLAVTVLAAPAGLADVPDFVTYSGRLTDGTAWGQSTTLDLTFRIYHQADGGQLLHEQVFENAAVEDGYFSVMLTSVADVFGAHDQTWITVCVGAGCGPGDDLLPRQQVGSVPYTMRAGTASKAGDADTVDGYDMDQPVTKSSSPVFKASNFGSNPSSMAGYASRMLQVGGGTSPMFVLSGFGASHPAGAAAGFIHIHLGGEIQGLNRQGHVSHWSFVRSGAFAFSHTDLVTAPKVSDQCVGVGNDEIIAQVVVAPDFFFYGNVTILVGSAWSPDLTISYP